MLNAWQFQLGSSDGSKAMQTSLLVKMNWCLYAAGHWMILSCQVCCNGCNLDMWCLIVMCYFLSTTLLLAMLLLWCMLLGSVENWLLNVLIDIPCLNFPTHGLLLIGSGLMHYWEWSWWCKVLIDKLRMQITGWCRWFHGSAKTRLLLQIITDNNHMIL